MYDSTQSIEITTTIKVSASVSVWVNRDWFANANESDKKAKIESHLCGLQSDIDNYGVLNHGEIAYVSMSLLDLKKNKTEFYDPKQ